MELEGKSAIVTGATQGIGREIAFLLAKQGASVTTADIKLKEAQDTAQIIESRGGRALASHVDVSKGDQVEAMVSFTVEAFGSVDLLVNDAGISISSLILDTTEEDFDLMWQVNVKGQFLCAQEVAKAMIRQGSGGRIINISSGSAINARVEGGAYCASKAGLEQLTRVMAMELAEQGINVNAVSPGFTDRADGPNPYAPPAYRQSMLSHIPQGRAGVPREIAQVVLFLATPGISEHIIGEIIHMDGGYSAGKFGLKGHGNTGLLKPRS